MQGLASVFALSVLALLTTCGPPPPSAEDLYRQDQIRRGKIAPPATGSAEACEPVAIARLPIEVRGRLLTVPIHIDGQELRMVVDSGAERTTISEKAAARLHLGRDMSRIRTSTGLGGSVVSADAIVSNFALGNVRLPPVDRVAVGKFGFDNDAVPLADGLLGADILLAFDLDIDVPGKALTLYRVRRCLNNQPPWQEPFVAIDGVTQKKDRLLIPFLLDGVRGQAILDTGVGDALIGEDFLEGRRVWMSFPTKQVFVSKLSHEIGKPQ